MVISLANTLAITMADALDTALGATATVRVYDDNGAGLPANANATATGNLLVTLDMNATPFGNAVDDTPNALITANAIVDGTAALTGTPTYYRLMNADITAIVQGDAAVGSGSLNFDAAITSGANVSITALTLSVLE